MADTMMDNDSTAAAAPTETRKHALAREGMAYREGDGPEIQIPPGPCELVITAADVTITWERDGVRGAAAIPLADYHLRIQEGVLAVS